MPGNLVLGDKVHTLTTNTLYVQEAGGHGIISLQQAREAYGAVLDEETLQLDAKEMDKLRKA